MLEAKAKRLSNGMITVSSRFENGSNVEAMEELVAIVEDVVKHLIKLHEQKNDGATPQFYYGALSKVFADMAKE